jgi:hypothetical protein
MAAAASSSTPCQVGLSRCKGLDGIGHAPPQLIQNDQHVKEQYR